MALTKVKTNAVAGIPASVYNAHVPSGSILQTVSTNDMTAASYTGNSSTSPNTVISLSITPSSTSSKILIFGFVSIGGKYSDFSAVLDYIGVRLKRGSTVIGETTDLSTATTVHGADASGASPMHSVATDAGYSASRTNSIPFHFIDSPNTTSATTYNIQGVIEHSGSTRTMLRNIGGYNYNNDEMASGTCQLTLMEISG